MDSEPEQPVTDTHHAAQFDEVIPPCMEQIRRGARRLTTNRFDAEDLVQETLLKAYSGFHTFEPGSNARAWLFRIMYNNWVNSYRVRQRGPAEQLCEDFTDLQFAAEARHAASGLQSAEAQAMATMRNDEIADALSAIPDTNRMVVYYADIAGYHYREIAEIMDTPVGTVMSRLARGRRRLRVLLTDVAKDRGVGRAESDHPSAMESVV